MRSRAPLALVLAACATPSGAQRSELSDLGAEACEAAPPGDASLSPLRRHMIGRANVEDGVVVYLDPNAVRSADLLLAIRCHRDWMALEHRGMEDCPLGLSGIRVAAYGDPTQLGVELTVQDPALVPELRRRVEKDLEATTPQRARDSDED